MFLHPFWTVSMLSGLAGTSTLSTEPVRPQVIRMKWKIQNLTTTGWKKITRWKIIIFFPSIIFFQILHSGYSFSTERRSICGPTEMRIVTGFISWTWRFHKLVDNCHNTHPLPARPGGGKICLVSRILSLECGFYKLALQWKSKTLFWSFYDTTILSNLTGIEYNDLGSPLDWWKKYTLRCML